VEVVSVNVGQPREVPWRGRRVRTSIFKEPVAGPVEVTRLGLEGDSQSDLRVHGGADKAVYAYPLEHYAHWQAWLGREEPLPPGRFGENLTVLGLLEDEVAIGDRLRAGSALLEVSQPRTPCFKLGIRMGTGRIQKPFLRSGRVGFYLRVVEAGRVRAGDPIERVARGAGGLTVRDASRLMYLDREDREGAARAADVEALAAGWREAFRHRAAAAS
jgi:MOSC domain-containing protein YiiM